MKKIASKDGTAIAFEQSGKGHPIILIDGALCSRSFGPMPKLALQLGQHFTVFTYDRRGRGESGDAATYAVDREVEDVEALIKEAGGSTFMYGISCGAALALEAASRLLGIEKLALYEAPFIVDDTHPPIPECFLTQLEALITSERRDEAVKLFMERLGAPPIFVTVMRLMGTWSQVKAVAHTLSYDVALVQDNQRGKPLPPEQWASVTVPTLVGVGGRSPMWMRNAMQALADVLPNAKCCKLEGQAHMPKPEAIAPVLLEFFADKR